MIGTMSFRLRRSGSEVIILAEAGFACIRFLCAEITRKGIERADWRRFDPFCFAEWAFPVKIEGAASTQKRAGGAHNWLY